MHDDRETKEPRQEERLDHCIIYVRPGWLLFFFKHDAENRHRSYWPQLQASNKRFDGLNIGEILQSPRYNVMGLKLTNKKINARKLIRLFTQYRRFLANVYFL